MTALSTGVRGGGWKDIEVIRHKIGAPAIRLHGRAKKAPSAWGSRQSPSVCLIPAIMPSHLW